MYRVAASSEATLRRLYAITAATGPSQSRHRTVSALNPVVAAMTRTRLFYTGTAAAAGARSIRSAPLLQHTSCPALPSLTTRPIPLARTTKVSSNLRRRLTTKVHENAAAEEE
ncbi:hypothetical protein BGZ83_000600, partial [Gryganskiella cystojenkinii]